MKLGTSQKHAKQNEKCDSSETKQVVGSTEMINEMGENNTKACSTGMINEMGENDIKSL
jgi:hypothetical protein